MPTKTQDEICVRDVMTVNPVYVTAITTPRQLAQVLVENDISGVPVVNGGNHVIGVVSKTDLLQWCVKGGLGFGASDLLRRLADGGGTRVQPEDLGIVADFMNSSPLTASPDEPLTEVAHRMARKRVHRLIVLNEDGSLLGIITSLDLLEAYPSKRPRF